MLNQNHASATNCPHPKDARFQDITGLKFSRLTVIAYAGQKGRKHYWQCACQCGNTSIVTRGNLTRGNTKSCGCYREQRRIESHTTHGKTGTPEHRIWSHMLGRCNNPSDHVYPRYGGRGITVCERWQSSFEDFLADMGERPSAKHSIERRKNDEGYSPGNCYWATATEQARNRSGNRMVTYQGIEAPLVVHCERHNRFYFTVRDRLDADWTEDRALGTPTPRPYKRLHS